MKKSLSPPHRLVHAPRGTKLNCKGWIQEAALRMLMNNLDLEVAEKPAELIVYGATEPDASVAINKKPVELRKDGTFSLRFNLIDGKHTINIEAVSKDRKHKRSAKITVEQNTELPG